MVSKRAEEGKPVRFSLVLDDDLSAAKRASYLVGKRGTYLVGKRASYLVGRKRRDLISKEN